MPNVAAKDAARTAEEPGAFTSIRRSSMARDQAVVRAAMAIAIGLSLASIVCANPPDHANDNLTEIFVMSNRADLVSGGDALVEIVLPDKVKARSEERRVGKEGGAR